MFFIYTAVVAIVISMAVIPVMMKLAPVIGMIDMPDSRKVHANPIARVGGIGIAIGAMLPVLLFSELTPLIESFLMGGLVLMIFGMLDDAREMGHYPKFIGQLLAVGIVIFHGDIVIHRLPFLDTDLVPVFGIPLTFIAMVGVINAINHSDGLDGLAAGESLMSLIVIAILAYSYNGFTTVLIACGLIGGILGFLRYNTHPARVFMGDSGSQFIGFTVAVLAIVLTHQVNVGLSAAIPLLLIGLPIVDILVVLYLRASGGQNWFKATRNHIHHRLLDLGFQHYETVIIIYTVQAFLVTMAMVFRFEMDLLLIMTYLIVCVGLFTLLSRAENRSWRVKHNTRLSEIGSTLHGIREHAIVQRMPLLLLSVGVPVYFIGSSLSIQNVPTDFGVISLLLFVLLVLEPLIRQQERLVLRGAVYATVVFVVYLHSVSPGFENTVIQELEVAFFVLLALAIVVLVRLAKEGEFRTTPTDYLLIFVIFGIAIFSNDLTPGQMLSEILVKVIIALYAMELLINRLPKSWAAVNLATMATLAVLGFRGLM